MVFLGLLVMGCVVWWLWARSVRFEMMADRERMDEFWDKWEPGDEWEPGFHIEADTEADAVEKLIDG